MKKVTKFQNQNAKCIIQEAGERSPSPGKRWTEKLRFEDW